MKTCLSINTPLQWGDSGIPRGKTASAVSPDSEKPLKRFNARRPPNTPLKPGVNETWRYLIIVAVIGWCVSALGASHANRLTYLESDDPFYPGSEFPKLTTPQWVGERDVDAVVILAVDDMRETARYETFLRPILDRLKQIDGRAPVSIMVNGLTPTN